MLKIEGNHNYRPLAVDGCVADRAVDAGVPAMLEEK
jgi:hypothetical protein